MSHNLMASSATSGRQAWRADPRPASAEAGLRSCGLSRPPLRCCMAIRVDPLTGRASWHGPSGPSSRGPRLDPAALRAMAPNGDSTTLGVARRLATCAATRRAAAGRPAAPRGHQKLLRATIGKRRKETAGISQRSDEYWHHRRVQPATAATYQKASGEFRTYASPAPYRPGPSPPPTLKEGRDRPNAGPIRGWGAPGRVGIGLGSG